MDLDHYTTKFAKIPFIKDKKQERKLIVKAKKGQKQAIDQLVSSNLLYVRSIAKKMYHNNKLLRRYSSIENLFSYGIDGLYDAITKFDLNYDVKFKTYANFHIRKAMLSAIYNRNKEYLESGIVRTPSETLSNINKYNQTIDKLSQTQHIVCDEDITKELGWTKRRLETTKTSIKFRNMGAGIQGNKLTDNEEPKDFNDLYQAINKLPSKQKTIITKIYGINTSRLSAKAISKKLGVSEFTIHHYKKDAMLRLANMMAN